MALLNFNASTVEPSQSFDILPEGWYSVTIVKSEMKPTKDGKGSYLQLNLAVADGPHAKRVVFDRLNLNNANEQAKNIAYQTLSSICHATGVIQLQDSSQLHGILMQAKLKVRKDEKYGESNEVVGYKSAAQNAAPSFVSQSAPAAAPVGQPAAAPPWANQ